VLDHARDLGAHAGRGLDVAHRHVGVEQQLDVAIAEHRGLRSRASMAACRAGLQPAAYSYQTL
jgi:hypothetical protein